MTAQIRPQPGPQEAFASSPADIAIIGGAFGGGKTFILELDPLRHILVPGFSGVTFRRTLREVKQKGGLWDTSLKIYPHAGGRPKIAETEWVFGDGTSSLQFRGLEDRKAHLAYISAQLAFIGFDQLEQFSWEQFAFLISRNRSTCGVKPYLRATCNPDPDSWLREFVRPWIDDESGYAIPEESGKIRYCKLNDRGVTWHDSPGPGRLSATFIPATLEDNPALREADPSYEEKLEALGPTAYLRGRKGNWNVREKAGDFFDESWFEIVEAAPRLDRKGRYWDRATTPKERATATTAQSACLAGGLSEAGVLYVTHAFADYLDPIKLREAVRNFSSQDGPEVCQWFEQDPAAAGVMEARDTAGHVAPGCPYQFNRVHESKGLRATPAAANAKAGKIKLVRAPWNRKLLEQLVNFDGVTPTVCDLVDCLSGLWHVVNSGPAVGVWGRRRR